MDLIKNLLKKITPPDELKLENNGDIKLGSTTLFKCIFKADIDGDGEKECLNPFSTIKLGEDKISLVDETGRIDIPQTNLPEICQLRIVPPPEQESMSQEERAALNKACFDLQKIQREAANQVYFAKKIFNNTDPLSDCLFLRNCKSSCNLRFGKITYTISILDIIGMFLPMGWVNTIMKIANFASKLQEIYNIVNTIKETINLGIAFLNNFLKTTTYLSTFFASFKNLLQVFSQDDFGKLLADYSENLLKFSQAKSEAQNMIVDAQKESLSLINMLQQEKGVNFLFGEDEQSEAKRNELKNLINDYTHNFLNVEQVVSLLEENVKSIGEKTKKRGEIDCPQGKISLNNCFISTSTLSSICDVGLSEEEVEVYCPGGYFVIPFPQTLGIHKIPLPEEIEGELEVTCRANCTISCKEPVNNWFDSFKVIYYYNIELQKEIAKLQKHFSQYNLGPSKRIREIFSYLETNYNLLLASQQLLPLVEGERQYWLTRNNSILVNSFEEAEKWGEKNCLYDPDLAYFNWENKIKEFGMINFALVNEVLDFADWFVHNDENLSFQANFLPKESLKFIFSVPLINWQLEEINLGLTELEKKPEAEDASTMISQLKDKISQLKPKILSLNQTWFEKEKNSLDVFFADILTIKTLSKEILSILDESQGIFSEIIQTLGFSPAELTEVKELLFDKTKDLIEKFLNDLANFEEEKTIEEISVLLSAISGLEGIIEMFFHVQEQLSEIKPTLEIPVFQITANADDFLRGNFDFGGEADNFDSFKEKILGNPLYYLEKYFTAAARQISKIKSQLISLGKLESIKSETENIIDKCNILEQMISGDEELRNGCNTLEFIFKYSPKEIEVDCQALESSSLLDDETLADKCDLRDKVVSTITSLNISREEFLEIDNPKNWWGSKVCALIPPFLTVPGGLKPPQPNPELEECLVVADLLTPEFVGEILTEEFKEQCGSLQYQKDLKLECDYFELLKKAIDDNCGRNEECKSLREKISNLIPFCPGWSGEIPDLTTDENRMTESFENKNLEEAENVCQVKLSDMRTPLEKIMDVYSLLLAIKSGTLFYKGVKTSVEDAKRVYENAQKIITMIKELPGKLKESNEKIIEGSGLDIELVKCIANPAVGYNDQTGTAGGQVCPNINYLFSIIESNFSLLRSDLKHLDMVRRKKEWINLKAGEINASLIATYPIKYSSVNQLYNEAENIKKRSQNLWALATALNFAAENCTCGQSYCKFPLCISGVPLTLSPLTNAYCWLVYILRYPMLKQAKVLENYLK